MKVNSSEMIDVAQKIKQDELARSKFGLSLEELQKKEQESIQKINELKNKVASLKNRQIELENEIKSLHPVLNLGAIMRCRRELSKTTSLITVAEKELNEQLPQLEEEGTKLYRMLEEVELESKITEPEAFKILQSHGIEVVLDKYEKVLGVEKSSDKWHTPIFTSTSDFILVHKTHFIPEGGVIKTSKEVRKKIPRYFNIKNKSYEVNFEVQRNTVHTYVNGEVRSHQYGNWDDCEYMILIPFDDVPRENIAAANTVDTYTNGPVMLTPNSWIICPESEIEKVRQMNPGINVIGYSGAKALGAGDLFVRLLGYRLESGGARTWNDQNDEDNFKNIMTRENIAQGLHGGSKEQAQESNDMDVEFSVECCKFLRAGDFSEEEIQRCFFPQEGEYKNEDLLDGPFANINLFLTRMKEEGFELSDDFIELLQLVSSIRQDNKTDEPITISETVFENIPESRKKLVESLLEEINSAKLDCEILNSKEKICAIALYEAVMKSKGKKVEKPYELQDKKTTSDDETIGSIIEASEIVKNSNSSSDSVLEFVKSFATLDYCKSVFNNMNSFKEQMQEKGFYISQEYVDFFDRLKSIYGYKYVKLSSPLAIPENISDEERMIFEDVVARINVGEYEERDKLIESVFSMMMYGSIMASKENIIDNTETEQRSM